MKVCLESTRFFAFFGILLFSTSISPASTITLAAVGDIILDRGVAQQMEKRGLDYPFAETKNTLRAADIAFGNLECPISTQPKRSGKPVVFRAAPTTAKALSNAGFDVLSLANNHALDCGIEGLKETQSILHRQKIGFCGIGSTAAPGNKPLVIEKNNVRVAFVGFSQFGGQGIAPADDATVRRDITRAKKSADVVVASFHWGVENETRPDARQKALARLAAKCGADLILGHHPHILQGWELLPAADGRRALAVYSLGNFVFRSARLETRRNHSLSRDAR